MLSHFKRSKCWHTVNALPAPLCPVLLSLPHRHFCAIFSCCLICLRWPGCHMSRENYTTWIFNPACLLLLTLSLLSFVLQKDKFSVYIIQITPLSFILQTLLFLLVTQLSFRVFFYYQCNPNFNKSNWPMITLNYNWQKEQNLQFLPVRSCVPCALTDTV